MSEDKAHYDNKSQYDRIKAYGIPGEKLYAVYDCKGRGTGFVGITDQRVIFYDQGTFLKTKTMISIPYNQIVGVASMDEGGVLFKTSEITLITAAGQFSTMTIFNDVSVNYLGLGVKSEELGAFGVSIKSFDFGDIPYTTNQDMDGSSGRTFSPTFVTVGLTYSNLLTDVIHQEI